MQAEAQMKVEDLTIQLRNRSYWEAIDLGFALSRQWFFRLWGAWMIAALPIFLFTILVIYLSDNEYIRSFIFILFWWCKPLYEQPLLHILSRQLFSEPVTLRDVFKDYFKVVKPQLSALLLWRRFSLSRSFNNPIAMLENLTGKQRRNRLHVLHSQQSSASQWLTIVCVHLELILYFSTLAFVYVLIPNELNNGFTLWELIGEESAALLVITNIAYFIAISIIAPMYVSAGFALYITRRVKLEGWDIELAFKRMKNRLENQNHMHRSDKSKPSSSSLACIPFIAGLLVVSLSSPPSYADITPNLTLEDSKSTIEKVLKKDAFGEKRTNHKWTYIGTDKDNKDDDEPPTWLKKLFEKYFENIFGSEVSTALKIFEFIIWLAVGLLVIWLVNRYSHWLSWINMPSRSQKKSHSIPNTILGMEMNKESLPEDVLTSFSSLINAKQYREALSLLYRATLSSIVHRGDIEILDSATERECSDIVASKRDKNESNFFKTLTDAWILLAYADREPSLETLTGLRDEWSQHYSATNDKESEQASERSSE